jgi:periplasmic divalent cation tolerance protein
LLVLSNWPNLSAAQAIARSLVERRLAACVNVLPVVQSVYRWEGTIECTDEVSLLIKTSQQRYAELEAAIRAAHPYQLPEIVALPLSGLPAYLEWIVQETRKENDVQDL